MGIDALMTFRIYQAAASLEVKLFVQKAARINIF